MGAAGRNCEACVAATFISDACLTTAITLAPSWEAEQQPAQLTLGLLQLMLSSCLQLLGLCLLAGGHLRPGCQLHLRLMMAPASLLKCLRCQDGLQCIFHTLMLLAAVSHA